MTYIHMARVPVEREVVKVWNANHLKSANKVCTSKENYNKKDEDTKKKCNHFNFCLQVVRKVNLRTIWSEAQV